MSAKALKIGFDPQVETLKAQSRFPCPASTRVLFWLRPGLPGSVLNSAFIAFKLSITLKAFYPPLEVF